MKNMLHIFVCRSVLTVTNSSPVFFQLEVGWAQSFNTPGRSKEKRQYLPRRCLSRPPKKRAPIFLPRKPCWFTWKLPSPPARSRCHYLESKCYVEILTSIIFGFKKKRKCKWWCISFCIFSFRSWDLNKICYKSGVPIIENVMIERVSSEQIRSCSSIFCPKLWCLIIFSYFYFPDDWQVIPLYDNHPAGLFLGRG